MGKVVDCVLEAIATITKEQVGGIVQKYKLEKFVLEIEEKLREMYIEKYESETFFLSLDKFLISQTFYENIVKSIFSRTAHVSLNKTAYGFAIKYIEQNPQFSPYQSQVIDVVCGLAQTIYKEFLTCDILDINNALYMRMQNQMNIIHEDISVLGMKMDYIIKQLRDIPFDGEKAKDKRVDKNEYQQLHKILCDESISLFDKDIEYIRWISQNGDLKEGLVYIANNCEKMQDYQRAEKYYQYILKNYEEEEYRLYNDWGILELKQNRYDDAIAKFEKVLSIDANNINSLYNLAVSWFESEKDKERALEYIKRAYQCDPRDADVVSLYVAILFDDPDVDYCDIATKLELALESNPDDYYLNVNKGFLYLFQKEFAKGIEYLEELNKKYPRHILCVSLLAMMYAMKRVENSEKAIPLFREAYEITGEIGYLDNIRILEQGEFFDTITYNHKIYNVFSDDELRQYYSEKMNIVNQVDTFSLKE